MFRNGFVNIFSRSRLSAGWIDGHAGFALKNSLCCHLSDGIERSIGLWKIHLIARRLLVCEFINKNIEERPRLGSNRVLFLFSQLAVYTLTPERRFSRRFFRPIARAINKRSERSSTAGFSGKCYNKTRIQS